MKNKTTIYGILAVLSFVILYAVGIAYSDTNRLGYAGGYTFSPSATVSKTAGYTLTTSDSLCKVACSSANVTITLPAISGARPGVKTYKVVKTDSTAYAVVITAATGDTIGGEASRYLVNQNDYIVFTSGANRDWVVDYESPIVQENHATGTVTTKAGLTLGGAASAVSGAFGSSTTVQMKQGGKALVNRLFFKNTSGTTYYITLPNNPASTAISVTRSPSGF